MMGSVNRRKRETPKDKVLAELNKERTPEQNGGMLFSKETLEQVSLIFRPFHSDDDDDDDDDDGNDPTSFVRTTSSLEPGCLKDGGVLFVDEAYQLTAPHVPNAGRQVLDIILTEIENNVGNLVVIFAGYKEELESFFAHNPGLKSRIPHTLQFADFTDQELLQTLVGRIERKYKGRMRVEDGMHGKYMRVAIRRLARSRGKKGFGNARAVENVLLKIWERQAKRLSKRKNLTDKEVFTFTKEDILGPNPTDVRSTSSAWARLQQLTGLEEVKISINNMFEALEMNYRREMAEQAPLSFSLNRIFVGSPGTGKTTVAKLYGQILVDLGFLSNGEVITKNPADFIGEAVGKSEAQTKSILSATVGKVLIIDEAYMLDPGEASKRNDTYRGAVLDTLVAEVQSVPGEDRCVILLGYEDRLMEMFRNANPGLSGRFAADKPFRFEDFSQAQLWEILHRKLGTRNLKSTAEGSKAAMEVLNRARMRQDFSNGREVDNLVSSAMENNLQRQSKAGASNYGHDMILSQEDFDPNHGRAQQASANCTGKTTVARYMSTLLHDLGVLSTNKIFVECSAADFIGEHVGHTAPKTRSQFMKGLGGVLYIDDAHQLMEGGYATEAINELVRLLQKHSEKIVIILAGPNHEIEALMTKAHGIRGSVFKEIIFEKLTASECLTLLKRLLGENGIGSSIFSDQIVKCFVNQFEILCSMNHWRNANDAGSGLNLSVERANFFFQKMFQMKSAMQMNDPHNIMEAFRQTESAQLSISYHMSENKPQACFNEQATCIQTNKAEEPTTIKEEAYCAYDEQVNKIKSVQQVLQSIGQCEAGFDWAYTS
ncbi:protein CfxQ homolog [Trichoderma asperellum]|uniref:Protein CfxQ homolog n=1 Tax=Trichoderma asperellum TaxID=101201 RepID=A0A6V8RA25_TRIAP|nr:protein CfxQ homolog [Trichoderma asperellum]